MKKQGDRHHVSHAGWNTRTYFQQRLKNFAWTMIVMGASFALYYLGLFGNVEGPLQPAKLGENLAGIGISKTHLLVFFGCLTLISITWNWMYNLACHLVGLRLTCKRKIGAEGAVCGARVTRKKTVHKKTGRQAPAYVCEHGHKRLDAHFHPVAKGTLTHSVWVISLVLCAVVFFCSL